MALNKEQLKTDIKSLLENMGERTEKEEAMEHFSTQLADLIDDYIKSASIFATPAQVTSATMVAGTYPVTAANNLNVTIT